MVGRIEAQFEGQMWAPATAETVEDAEEIRCIERARTGDEAAISWLISRYRSRVVRLAAHVLRRPSEAEDVAQEAFLRAFRNLRDFRGDGRFYTWLYRIVVRQCLERRRLARWAVEVPIDEVGLRSDIARLSARSSTDSPRKISNFSNSAANPYATDSGSEGVETKVLVEMLLDRMSPPMRAMLALRELDGLEYEEIATVLEIPVGRVRWRLHAARAQFRELYKAVMQEIDHV